MIRETARPKEHLGMGRSAMRSLGEGRKVCGPCKRAGVSFLQVRLDALLKNKNKKQKQPYCLYLVFIPLGVWFFLSLEGRLVATNSQPFPVSPRQDESRSL